MPPILRLSASDVTNLAMEGPDTPMHQAALGVLDAANLLDSGGNLRIELIRAHVEARLSLVPELRQILHRTGRIGARLWVDDPDFQIGDHVRSARLQAPGGEAAALEFAEQALATLMDRSRPLWEMWFLENFAPGQVGLFVKIHHALADGPAMINIIGQIFDLAPDARSQPSPAWSPTAPPARVALWRDDLRRTGGWLARAASGLRHPSRPLRSALAVCDGVIEVLRQSRSTPVTSLNRPIGIARRVAVVRLPLGEVKEVAHREGVKLNDVFLAVVAAGLRQVLLRRGEGVDGVQLRASVAVSLHRPGDPTTSGNLVGTITMPLPVDGDDARARLRQVAQCSAHAKATQRAVVSTRLMVWLARSRLARRYIRRQRFINVLTTNLPGPPVPLYFSGAMLVDAVAIPPIAGNVTVSFAALSYNGRLNLSVVADGAAWPDLDVLTEAMREGWLALRARPRQLAAEPALVAVRG